MDYFNTIVKPELARLQQHGTFDYRIIDETDHTFTTLDKQKDLLAEIAAWAGRC
jgi:hypothetical protein